MFLISYWRLICTDDKYELIHVAWRKNDVHGGGIWLRSTITKESYFIILIIY